MHRLLLTLFLVSCSMIHAAHAQKSQPKKEKPWEEQITGDWVLDSVALYENGIRVKDSYFFNEVESTKVRVLPSGKVIFCLGNEASRFSGKIFASGYDLLTSKKGRFVSVDMAMNLCMRIEQLSEKTLKLKFNGFASSREAGMEIYFTRSTFPHEEIVKSLSGDFVAYKPYSYMAAMEDLAMTDTVIPVEAPPSLYFSLGPEGQMGNYMGSKKDTGTWTLNQEDLTIELKGKRSTQKLEIQTWESRSALYLRPAGAPQDSVIRLTQRGAMDEVEMSSIDSTAMPLGYDTMDVVTAPVTEYQGLTSEEAMLCKSWKAVSASSADYPFNHDTLERTIRLNLMKDGSFTFIDGKKKQHGKWRSMPNDGRLILTMKGKEQLAIYEFDYNLSPDGGYSDYYPDDLDPKLVISFIPPKSKTIMTYRFEKQKEGY